jgi:hypothetical protein
MALYHPFSYLYMLDQMDFIGEVPNINCNEIGLNNLMMDISKPLNPAPTSEASGSGSGLQVNPVTQAPENTDLNLDKPLLNLKLLKVKGVYYVTDTLEKGGYNLLRELQTPEGQEKPDLVSVRSSTQGSNVKALKLGLDGSTKMTSLEFEGRKYAGQYVDLKYPNATVTSLKLPIQKNETGSVFII